MFLQKRTKKGLRHFQTFLITSLLVIVQIVAPIQAVHAIDTQKRETLTKDLAMAAISEKQADQYAIDLKEPENLDFSDQQKVELTSEMNDHYFFIQNRIKEEADQTTTEISIPKGYQYNEALTKKMNVVNTAIHFTYHKENQLLSIQCSKDAAANGAILVLSGHSTEKASLYAKSVVKDRVFRSNQLYLINNENVPSNSSSDSTSESTNETTSSTTSSTATETRTTKEESKIASTETANEQATESSIEKTPSKTVKSSSLDDYAWQNCTTNEFLAVRSPTNQNYYTVIGFGGLASVGLNIGSLYPTQEQMFLLKGSAVSNQDTGPTAEEIKNNAIGYLSDGPSGWNGMASQGLSVKNFVTGYYSPKFQGNSTMLQKAMSEDNLPMLRMASDFSYKEFINGKSITRKFHYTVTLKVLPTGRVAHYITMQNMGDDTFNMNMYRELDTWLAGEPNAQPYAIGDNKGLYLKNTLKSDGTIDYVPNPVYCKDPYQIMFPVDGYPGQPDNWLGSHGPESVPSHGFLDNNNQEMDGGDERYNYPAGYNLATPDGTGTTVAPIAEFFRWNDITLEPGEAQDFRYDTNLTPLGTLTIDAEKTYKNETSTDEKNHVGDQLLFDLKAKNASKQVWNDGSIVDVLPEGLTVDSSSFVFVDTVGKETPLADDIYDASTRTIKVKLPGDVNPEKEVHVKFKATLDKSTAEKTITNTMQAIDASGNSTPASVDIKVEKADGPLTLDSVPNLYFGLNSIATKDTTYDAYAMKSEDTDQYVPNYAQVSDQRADHTGWTLAVAQANPFTADSGATLGPNTILTLTNQKVSGNTTSAVPPSFLANTVTLMPNNEAQTVFAAAANEGDGTWKSIWGTVATEKRYTEDTANPNATPVLQDTQVNKGVQLMVPGQVKKVSEPYVTNLDWVLSDTPAP